jgi:hypothetical protein
MATTLRCPTNIHNVLQTHPRESYEKQYEKTGIMHFINSIFKKQKVRPHQEINQKINPEIIYRMSCEKLKRRSSLLDKTLIINSVQNHLGLRVVGLKKRPLKINTKSTTTSNACNDEDVPLGVLRLKN